ncbi:hypothetical protein I317_04105 [Kwoniella heveanensis CBS 569]|nr:hypothetical protein I317_04105 [Kwoniella heveanensis CBS 569]
MPDNHRPPPQQQEVTETTSPDGTRGPSSASSKLTMAAFFVGGAVVGRLTHKLSDPYQCSELFGDGGLSKHFCPIQSSSSTLSAEARPPFDFRNTRRMSGGRDDMISCKCTCEYISDNDPDTDYTVGDMGAHSNRFASSSKTCQTSAFSFQHHSSCPALGLFVPSTQVGGGKDGEGTATDEGALVEGESASGPRSTAKGVLRSAAFSGLSTTRESQ